MEKFDAIIVGGGLAGLAAAYILAGEGMEVLVLERGDYPGAKNVTGGRLYVNPIRELFPELWKKAPMERGIAYEEVCIMDKERSITIRYDGSELRSEPYQSYSVLRGKFDKWFAKQAERKGAMIVNKSRVDDLVIENGQVKGVMAGGEELRANVVIACDGVLSFIAQKAGLGKPAESKNFAVGFKEIIEMDREIIENRFNLEGDEGAARLFMGDVTAGKFGGGFLYTNKESLSLGIVVGIDALNEGASEKAPELLDRFKQRAEIATLIKDGQTVEYSAHVIPEGGLKSMGTLYGDGILVAGDAAGFSMNIGVTVRGMEYAMASGYYAAQAVLQAKGKNDFSKATLSVYEKFLNESFVLKDFKSFKHSLEVLEYPPLFNHIPELAGNVMRDLYAVSAGPKGQLFPTIKKYMSLGEMWSLAKLGKRMMKI
jgi:electron transfer flavoprotein-quinone oxidoreductase